MPNIDIDKSVLDFSTVVEHLKSQSEAVEKALNGLDHRAERTSFLTKFISQELFFKFHLRILGEVRLEHYDRNNSKVEKVRSDRLVMPVTRGRRSIIKEGSSGYIDLRAIGNNNGERSILDIEIDTTSKIGSLYKLIHSKSILGHDVLWVRHGNLENRPRVVTLLHEYDITVIGFSSKWEKKGEKSLTPPPTVRQSRFTIGGDDI